MFPTLISIGQMIMMPGFFSHKVHDADLTQHPHGSWECPRAVWSGAPWYSCCPGHTGEPRRVDLTFKLLRPLIGPTGEQERAESMTSLLVMLIQSPVPGVGTSLVGRSAVRVSILAARGMMGQIEG